jgi:hypothetical protein
MIWMRPKALLLTLILGLLVVSSAVAAPPAGKGKPNHGGDDGTTASVGNGKPAATGVGCRPQVMVVLKGTLATAPGATPALPFSLQVMLSSANRFGEAFALATQPISVTVDSHTKITRRGSKTLASLLSGDRLLIQARACKADLTTNSSAASATTTTTTTTSTVSLPALTATHIIAHPAHT